MQSGAFAQAAVGPAGAADDETDLDRPISDPLPSDVTDVFQETQSWDAAEEDFLDIDGAEPSDSAYMHHLGAPSGRTTADGISLQQILHDRSDVFASFFTEFYGPHNDHRSGAWVDRVGGETPEDYANYWYETYGKAAGYAPRSEVAAPALDEYDPSLDGGRTTSDGVSLARILHDRPDVYRAFFTEFYGPNNDHHSHAWTDRVGGATPEDYANYWYETYGKSSGYVPSSAAEGRAFGSTGGAEDEPGSPAAATLIETPEALMRVSASGPDADLILEDSGPPAQFALAKFDDNPVGEGLTGTSETVIGLVGQNLPDFGVFYLP